MGELIVSVAKPSCMHGAMTSCLLAFQPLSCGNQSWQASGCVLYLTNTSTFSVARSGLVRDFYAARVKCYIDQAAVELPPSGAPPPPPCRTGPAWTKAAHSYLPNYPHSLPSSDGTHPPSTGRWPYDTGE